LELINLFLRIRDKAQAQGELIALAASVGPDPVQQERIGELFLRAEDYQHARQAFDRVLNADRHNAAALAGAGYAAFELRQYGLAEHYLQAALAANANDTASADRLKTTQMVLRMDPFRRKMSVSERDRIVVEAFQVAGERLNSCKPPVAGAWQPSMSDQWTRLKPQINGQGLRRNPDLVETAMDLVFRTERETSIACGPPTGTDLALLLISKMHEGS